MTDKEKIELKDNIINLFNRFNILDHASTIGGLRDDILKYIDSLQEDLASIDFEQELYKAFGQVKDFTLGMRIAKWFYDMGKNSQESVGENLEEAAFDYAEACKYDGGEKLLCVEHFKAGAQWQKEQMITKAIDARCFGFQDAALFSFRLPADNYLVGSEVKVIIIKED